MQKPHQPSIPPEQIEAREFCRAYGIPCVLDQADDDDRRAVSAMQRVVEGESVDHYLAGVRWRMLSTTGAHLPAWEVVGLDRRDEPTVPPSFGQWLDGRPNSRLANTASVLIEILRQSRAAAIAEYHSRPPTPALPITREQAAEIYHRQASLTRRMSSDVQTQVVIDAICEASVLVADRQRAAIAELWLHLIEALTLPGATEPAFVARTRALITQGVAPPDAVLQAIDNQRSA